ncbi:MAG: ABC transporter permease, partial [Melioribacteraceae bacterium]|nr:ABC transporter permease [Melioribacteraceae bacterium]
MFNRIKAIGKKEIKQLARDKRMMFVLFFFPVFLLIIFGYAVNFDVQKIKIAVLDKEHSSVSRNFVKTLSASNYFTVIEFIQNDERIKEILDNGLAKGVLVIPNDFSKKIYSSREPAKVQFL